MSLLNGLPDVIKRVQQHDRQLKELARRRLPATPTGNTVPEQNAGISGASFARYGGSASIAQNTIGAFPLTRLDFGEPDIFDAAGFGAQTTRFPGLWIIQFSVSIAAQAGDTGQLWANMAAIPPAEVFTARYPIVYTTMPLSPNQGTNAHNSDPTAELSIVCWLPAGTTVQFGCQHTAGGARTVGAVGSMSVVGLPST